MTKWGPFEQAFAVASATQVPPRTSEVDLREIFRMHSAYVWSTLKRLGVPFSDLDDLTHDVFLQVHRKFDEFDPTRPVRPWLFAFAYRVACQHRRRAHLRHEFPGEPDKTAHPGLAPDEQVAAGDGRRLILAALDCLPMERRAVFVLYEIDGVSIDEIAHAMGIPQNTAYSRLRVARAEFETAAQRLRRRNATP